MMPLPGVQWAEPSGRLAPGQVTGAGDPRSHRALRSEGPVLRAMLLVTTLNTELHAGDCTRPTSYVVGPALGHLQVRLGAEEGGFEE